MRDLAGLPPAAGVGLDRIAAAALSAYLFVLPVRSSVAMRNSLLWGAVLLLAIHFARRRREWAGTLPPLRLLLPLAAWVTWCVASLAWSVVPRASLDELRPELLTPIAAFLAFHAATDRPARLDLWATAFAAGLAGLAALAIWQEWALGAWDPRRWHVDVGYYSTHVVLTLPFLAWLAWRSRQALARAALAAVALATLLVTWWTDNRIVWPTLAAMVLLGAVLAARRASSGQRRALALGLALAVAAAAVLFVAAQHERGESLRRMDANATPDFATDPRLRIWPLALERWEANFWLGRGFGRPALALPAAQADGMQDPRLWHAHNIFLDVALELGAIGLAIFVAGLAAIARELARGLSDGALRRAAAIVGLVAMVGFAMKNFPDDFVVRHIALACAAIAGMLTRAMRWPEDAATA